MCWPSLPKLGLVIIVRFSLSDSTTSGMAFGGTEGRCGSNRLSSLGVLSGDTIPTKVAAKNLIAMYVSIKGT